MKKLLFVFVAVAFILASCSKENKLNRRLDGDWNVVSYGTETIPSGSSIVLSFSKDKKGLGTYVVTMNFDGDISTETGKYELEKDEKITMTSNESGSTPDVFTITEYSKTDLKLKDSDNEELVLKKK